MAFIYDRLFEQFKNRGISTYTIRKENLISQAALTKMKSGKGNIDTRTLERICAFLECQPGDIMEWVPDTVNTDAQGPSEPIKEEIPE